MNAVTNAKTRVSAFADKVTNSKAYRTAERLAVGASAGLTAMGVTAMNAFAADGNVGGADIGAIATAAANVDNVMKNATPFIEPAIIIMCGVAGLRLGMKFLRGSTR